MGSGERAWTSALFRAGQVGSLVVLEELQGVRRIELAAESRGQGAGCGRDRRMCVRGIASGNPQGGRENLSREASVCQEGGISDSHQEAHIPEVSYYLYSGVGLDLVRAQ